MATAISARIKAMENDELMKMVELWREHGTCRAVAAAVEGLTFGEVQRQIREAALRGLIPFEGQKAAPGFKITKATVGPTGVTTQQKPAENPEKLEPTVRKDHYVQRVSTLKNANGEKMAQWVITHQDKGAVDWEAIFENAFKNYERPPFNITPVGTADEHKINLFPCNDWHVNMLCWKREVAVNWDLKIAEKVLGDTIDATVARCPRAKLGVVLGGGDLMHNDDNTNRTAKSHNLLDCDGRFEKGLEVAQRLKIRAIDAMLFKHDEVLVVVLKGNHDEQASIAIKHYLKAWYRDEPRVKIEMSSALLWEYDQGKVLLAATHGHAMKMRQLPQIVADRFSEAWGRTKKRYAHTFHVHHKDLVTSEGGGIIVESHQAPIPQDAWHYGEGFLSGRSMQIITYDDRYGETGRVTEAVMDG